MNSFDRWLRRIREMIQKLKPGRVGTITALAPIVMVLVCL